MKDHNDNYLTDNVVKNIEQMDPDFGRGMFSGEGFGAITEEEYAQLEEKFGNQ